MDIWIFCLLVVGGLYVVGTLWAMMAVQKKECPEPTPLKKEQGRI